MSRLDRIWDENERDDTAVQQRGGVWPPNEKVIDDLVFALISGAVGIKVRPVTSVFLRALSRRAEEHGYSLGYFLLCDADGEVTECELFVIGAPTA